jgi:hypothetical protein
VWLQRVEPFINAAITRTTRRLQQKNNAITQYFRPTHHMLSESPNRQYRPKRQNKSHADTYDPP